MSLSLLNSVFFSFVSISSLSGLLVAVASASANSLLSICGLDLWQLECLLVMEEVSAIVGGWYLAMRRGEVLGKGKARDYQGSC